MKRKIVMCCMVALCALCIHQSSFAQGKTGTDDGQKPKVSLIFYQGKAFEAGGKFNGKASSGFGIGITSKRERTYVQLEMKIKDVFNARDTLGILHENNMSSLKLFSGFCLSNERSMLFHGSGIGLVNAIGFTQKGNTAFEKNPFMTGLYIQINANYPKLIKINLGNSKSESFHAGLFIRPAYTVIVNSIDDAVRSPQFMGTVDAGIRILIDSDEK